MFVKEILVMANKRKAAIVTVGIMAVVGVAVLPAWLRLKEIESKGVAIGSTKRLKAGS